jgi:hypothetical protein
LEGSINYLSAKFELGVQLVSSFRRIQLIAKNNGFGGNSVIINVIIALILPTSFSELI